MSFVLGGPGPVVLDKYTPPILRGFHVALETQDEYPRAIKVWYGNMPNRQGRQVDGE
jgi:hypothetical protein